MTLGVLDPSLFTMMVIMALITTGMAGFVLPPAAPDRLGAPTPAAPESVPSRSTA